MRATSMVVSKACALGNGERDEFTKLDERVSRDGEERSSQTKGKKSHLLAFGALDKKRATKVPSAMTSHSRRASPSV